MPRVALRQFLRSSFDPVDKTMGSPIIACLSAASLLILASCSFGSINADSSLDAGESSTEDPNLSNIGFRVFPSERFLGISGHASIGKGMVRHIIHRPEPTKRTRISRTSPRPLYVAGELGESVQQQPSVSTHASVSAGESTDYFTSLGEQGILIVDIVARGIDAAVSNIIANIDNHRNGRINVNAKTLKGAVAGNKAEKYFKHFFKASWVGIIAHIVQEIVDQFYIGSAIYCRYRGESDTEDYADVSVTAASLQIDMAEDFDQWEINEYEDPVGKTYHCSAQSQTRNDTLQPNLETIKFLDDNGLAAVRPKKNYYQVQQIRRKMCLFGFDPFQTDPRIGSIHKRFKNTLRLMIYNTPGIFPGLKVIRNDLDRKRRREPQIWFSFEASSGPLSSEFDYDNYFVTISGDFARIQAYSKMLVALKMHKRLNNFNNSVSYKINLDLSIMEVIMSSFGIALMRDKSTSALLVKALNGVRTEIKDDETVQLEFDEKLKEAADQVDPLLYSSIWLLSMAEKYEVVRIRDRARSIQVTSVNHQNRSVE